MAKRYDLLFETDRFNLSEPKDYFINPCCYGDDLSAWLRGRLAEYSIETTRPEQEDWGWSIYVRQQSDSYFVGISGTPRVAARGNLGEWRLMIKKRRSPLARLTSKKQMTESEEIISILKRIVRNEPDLKFLRVEGMSR